MIMSSRNVVKEFLCLRLRDLLKSGAGQQKLKEDQTGKQGKAPSGFLKCIGQALTEDIGLPNRDDQPIICNPTQLRIALAAAQPQATNLLKHYEVFFVT